jgi:hypothetical protein
VEELMEAELILINSANNNWHSLRTGLRNWTSQLKLNIKFDNLCGLYITAQNRPMNYVDFEKSLGKLLRLPDKRTSKSGKLVAQHFKGVYVISRERNDLTFKLGMAHGAGGLKPRLQGYKICYPYADEYFIHYILITPTSADARALERIVLADSTLKNTVQKGEAQGKKSVEYKMVSDKATLKKALVRALDNNVSKWTHAIVFGDNGWKIIRNIDGSAVKSLSKPKYTTKKKPGLYDAVDVDITTFNVERRRKWKKGSTLNTPWGKATVKSIDKNGDLEAKFPGYKGTSTIKLH